MCIDFISLIEFLSSSFQLIPVIFWNYLVIKQFEYINILILKSVSDNSNIRISYGSFSVFSFICILFYLYAWLFFCWFKGIYSFWRLIFSHYPISLEWSSLEIPVRSLWCLLGTIFLWKPWTPIFVFLALWDYLNFCSAQPLSCCL